MYAAWGSFNSRRPMNTHAEKEWRKHIAKVKDRVKHVKLSSDIKESTSVLHPKTKPTAKKITEYDVLRKKGVQAAHDWMDEMRHVTIQESVETERQRRQDKARELQQQQETEREQRVQREAARQAELQQRHELQLLRRRQKIETRKSEADKRRQQILSEREELREKVAKEKERRLLSQAWSSMSNLQNYEQKHQIYLETQREREASLSSRLQLAEEERQKNKERYLAKRRRRSAGSSSSALVTGRRKANSAILESELESKDKRAEDAMTEPNRDASTRLRLAKSRETDKSGRTRKDLSSQESDNPEWCKKTGLKKRFTPWKQEQSLSSVALTETLTERRARMRQYQQAERAKNNSKFMWKLISTKPATRTRMSSLEQLEHIRQLRSLSHSNKRDELDDELQTIGVHLQRAKPALYHQFFRPKIETDVVPLKSRVRPAEVHWR